MDGDAFGSEVNAAVDVPGDGPSYSDVPRSNDCTSKGFQLRLRQRSPNTPVGSRAKRQVLASIRAVRGEPVRIGELSPIAVGGAPCEHHAIACLHDGLTYAVVTRQGAEEPLDRRPVSKSFQDKVRNLLRMRSESMLELSAVA